MHRMPVGRDSNRPKAGSGISTFGVSPGRPVCPVEMVASARGSQHTCRQGHDRMRLLAFGPSTEDSVVAWIANRDESRTSNELLEATSPVAYVLVCAARPTPPLLLLLSHVLLLFQTLSQAVSAVTSIRSLIFAVGKSLSVSPLIRRAAGLQESPSSCVHQQ